MTLVGGAPAVFGAGGDEPYGRALDGGAGGTLRLHPVGRTAPVITLDVARWRHDATHADLSVLRGARGPLLDVGCGPGRMVRAATRTGLTALGIDVSAEAVALTRSDGSPALRRSIFDRLPLEGGWGTVLLLDGNIGIGGDPEALLRRCGEMLAPLGSIVVETDPDRDADETSEFTVSDEAGRESAPFPWARLGSSAAQRIADALGMIVTSRWDADGRHLLRLHLVAGSPA